MKKSFFLNLIALLGYIVPVVILIACFIWFPEALTYGKDNLDPDISYASVWVGLITLSRYFCLLLLILFLLVICEYFLHKWKKWDGLKRINIPTLLSKIHTVLFWLGVTFALIPFVFVVFIFIAKFLMP